MDYTAQGKYYGRRHFYFIRDRLGLERGSVPFVPLRRQEAHNNHIIQNLARRRKKQILRVHTTRRGVDMQPQTCKE